MYRDLTCELVLPLPSYEVSKRYELYENRPSLSDALEYLADNGHASSMALDLSYFAGGLDSFFAVQRRFQKSLGYTDTTHMKYKIENVWRKVPVLDMTADEHGWTEYGIPMILTSRLSSPDGGRISTFHEINLHEREGKDHPGFLLSTGLFSHLCSSMGLAVGTNDDFAARISSAMTLAFDSATIVNK